MQLRETQFQFEWEGMLFQIKSNIQGHCTMYYLLIMNLVFNNLFG